MKTRNPNNLLHIRRAGTGPTLILIHGVAGSGAIWGDVATDLEKNFDVVRLDLLGYGFSPKPRIRYTMAAHITAIRKTLHEANIKPPYHLVGLSMGALVCLEWAATHPVEVQSVSAIGLPYYRSAGEAREKLRETFWANLVIHRKWLARIVIPVLWGAGRHSKWLSRTVAPKMYKGEIARESMMATHRSFSSTMQECMVNYRLDDSLPKIKCPVLFVHGGEDQWTPLATVKTISRNLPRSRVLSVSGELHNIVVFAPAKTATAIREFVRSSMKIGAGVA